MLRLNLGAGDTEIDGFTAIDRKTGGEVYPLEYETDSVDEIRASHVLEHFSFKDARAALEDWYRTLKPGARIRVAVPDFEKIEKLKNSGDPHWHLFLMGGQTDKDNFHSSVWTPSMLRAEMSRAGFEDVKEWEADNIDTANHPSSLNMEGVKKSVEDRPCEAFKVTAVMSIPRLGFNDAWGCIVDALTPFNIPVARYTGAFWDQCIERSIEDCIDKGVDWILAIDYDSLFTKWHLDRMFEILGDNPHIDALAPLQPGRSRETALFTTGKTSVDIDAGKVKRPIKVASAAFGLTMLKVDAIRDLPKPWFHSKPSAAGNWNDDDKIDADIWFWHQMREAGKEVYVAPDIRIGHLELVASCYDENLDYQHMTVKDWLAANKK